MHELSITQSVVDAAYDLLDGVDALVLVDVVGGRSRVNLGMLDDPEVSPGDWVLIHTGFAIERIDEAGAERALAGLEMMGRPRDDTGQAHGAAFEAQLRPTGS